MCYNHQQYVLQTIESVLKQTYERVELIVVDDASEDKSREIIEKAQQLHGFKVIFNEKNLGNCSSFNRGFQQSNGKYLIDLAADDLLEAERIALGVEVLEKKGESYGVHFCDVELIDYERNIRSTHFNRNSDGQLAEKVPSGDIYATLVERYLICTPSMMMSKKVLDELDGYDENLSYEDFDFWVRSSRNYKYAFSDKVLVKKIILSNSLSSAQYQRKNEYALSTAKVCAKVLHMNKNEDENQALLKRINYELKWALITENWEASHLFLDLKKKLGDGSIRTQLEKLAVAIKSPWYWFWKRVI